MKCTIVRDPRPPIKSITVDLSPDELRYVCAAVGNVNRSEALRWAKLSDLFNTMEVYRPLLEAVREL